MKVSKDLNTISTNFNQTLVLLQGLPFDMAREQYAKAVQLGLIERSMIAWAKFERQLDLLEKMTLGPWARRV